MGFMPVAREIIVPMAVRAIETVPGYSVPACSIHFKLWQQIQRCLYVVLYNYGSMSRGGT